MQNVKKLISLSLYLNKNSLIKESSYLKSLIKESGYDWKEMGKAPHLKKDEYEIPKKENIQEENKEELKAEDEPQSWFENSDYENINQPGNYELGDKKEEEVEVQSDIDPGMLDLLKQKMSVSQYEFGKYFPLLNREYKAYAKYIAKEYPFHFISFIVDHEKYKKTLNKEMRIAITEIFKVSSEAIKSFESLFGGSSLESIILLLREFGYVIFTNEKLLSYFASNEGRALNLVSMMEDYKEKMISAGVNYEKLIYILYKTLKETAPLFLLKTFGREKSLPHKDMLLENLLKSDPHIFLNPYIAVQLSQIFSAQTINEYVKRAGEEVSDGDDDLEPDMEED
jgi:hypothetical protein